MFGWFRKRESEADGRIREDARPRPGESRSQASGGGPARGLSAPHPSAASTSPARPSSARTAAAHEPGRPEIDRGEHELAPSGPRIVAAAPSARPAMPLAERPNFAGLDVADHEPPRLLEPRAALSEAARDELTALLADMFGARGRYRLEWRPDREPGDDAVFSEIMVADLVRRIQNAIGEAVELEAAPATRRELRAARPRPRERERELAIEAFLKPAETDEQLAAAVAPPAAATASAAAKSA